MFWCPGCHDVHVIDRSWSFNDDLENPTIQPSVLVQSGHYTEGFVPGSPCWCSFNEEHRDEPSKFHCYRCHSFVTDGEIQFLNDCSHDLAGKTVPLPEYKEE
jgi:hypothetical protein